MVAYGYVLSDTWNPRPPEYRDAAVAPIIDPLESYRKRPLFYQSLSLPSCYQIQYTATRQERIGT